jgi:hypothetical protein
MTLARSVSLIKLTHSWLSNNPRPSTSHHRVPNPHPRSERSWSSGSGTPWPRLCAIGMYPSTAGPLGEFGPPVKVSEEDAGCCGIMADGIAELRIGCSVLPTHYQMAMRQLLPTPIPRPRRFVRSTTLSPGKKSSVVLELHQGLENGSASLPRFHYMTKRPAGVCCVNGVGRRS